MKITWHGHAFIEIQVAGKQILIDPFITGNPFTKTKPEDFNPDYILLTHSHRDHVGDMEELAKKSGATIVTEMDMVNDYAQKGFKVEGPNYGGTVHFDWGDVKIIPAWHTTANVPLGMATGLALTIEGKLIYIAGDTGLFSDMKLVGRKQQIDLAFLPIGDYYTMGPDDAAYAASLIEAKKVIPDHFNTFPPIKQDVNDFWKDVPENMKFTAEIDKPFEL